METTMEHNADVSVTVIPPADVRHLILYEEVILWVGVALILSTNSLTALALWMSKPLRKTRATLYICSLNVANFCTGLALILDKILLYTGITHIPSRPRPSDQAIESMRAGFLIVGVWLVVNLAVSVFTLMAIAFDRMYAVARPHSYKIYLTKKRVLFILFLIWLYMGSVLGGTMSYYGWTASLDDVLGIFTILDVLPIWALNYVILVHVYLMTLGDMAVYVGVMVLIYRKTQKLRSAVADNQINPMSNRENLRLKHSRRWIRMNFVSLIGITLSQLPYALLAGLWDPHSPDAPAWVKTARPIVFNLLYSSAWLNSFIYCWQNSVYRQAYKNALICLGVKIGLIRKNRVNDVGLVAITST